MKVVLKKIYRLIAKVYKTIAVPFWKGVCKISRLFASFSHYRLFHAEWFFDSPENFDHDINLYWYWGKSGIAHWLERGIYNILAIQIFDKPKVVELCCGEGFNAKYFYSYVSENVYSCDFDKKAIHEAKKKYHSDNVVYNVKDIRYNLQEDIYKSIGGGITNIIWDTAIEHFTPTEIDSIMKVLYEMLKEKHGILSGHTIVERLDGKSLEQHEYEFKNKEDLKRFFTPYFRNVTVFETIYKDRHNLYFWASDGILPFSEDWEHWC